MEEEIQGGEEARLDKLHPKEYLRLADGDLWRIDNDGSIPELVDEDSAEIPTYQDPSDDSRRIRKPLRRLRSKSKSKSASPTSLGDTQGQDVDADMVQGQQDDRVTPKPASLPALTLNETKPEEFLHIREQCPQNSHAKGALLTGLEMDEVPRDPGERRDWQCSLETRSSTGSRTSRRSHSTNVTTRSSAAE